MRMLRGSCLLLASVFLVCSGVTTPAQDQPDDSVAAQQQILRGENLIIAWPESNDELRGFSEVKGEWATISVETDEKIIPIVAADVACVPLGKSIAAFSAVKGRWDVVTLSDNWQRLENGLWPVSVDGGLVQAQDGDHLYTFSASTGRWTSPTDPELQSSEATIVLKHVSGRDLQQSINDWMNSQNPTEVQGSLTISNRQVRVYSRRRSWMEAVQAKLAELDVPTQSALGGLEPGSISRTDAVALSSATKVRGMEERLRDAEQQAAAEANALRQSSAAGEENREQLIRLVEEAFQIRQAMQLADVERMELKLQQIRTNLAAREKIRDRIVQRRVDELLDPRGVLTGWDVRGHAAAQPETLYPTTGAPIGLPGPPTPPRPQVSAGTPGRLPQSAFRQEIDSVLPEINLREPVEVASQLRTLRDRAVQLTSQIAAAETRIANVTAEQHELAPDADPSELTEILSPVNSAMNRDKATLDSTVAEWRSAWSAYQTHLRLRQLDVDEAQIRLKSTEAELERMKRLVEKGLASSGEIQKVQSAVSIAEIELAKAEEVLKLTSDIHSQEPQLDPTAFEVKP